MWNDGVLAFIDSGGDPDVSIDAALSTFIFVDDGTDVPEHTPVYPRDDSPKDLERLNDILGQYASSRGWDGFVLGDEI